MVGDHMQLNLFINYQFDIIYFQKIMLFFHNKIRLLNICVLFGITFTCLMLELLLINSENLILTWLKQSSHVSLFLSEDISNEDYQALHNELKNDKLITKIQEWSSEQTFELMKPHLDTKFLKDNLILFPKTIEFEIIPDYQTNSKYIIKKYEIKNGVTEIVFDQQSFKLFKLFSNDFNIIYLVIENLGRVFILIFILYSIFFFLNNQKEELQLFHLLGISSLIIYKLFLRELSIIIVMAILLAHMITYLIYVFLINQIFKNIIPFHSIQVLFFSWQDLAIDSSFILIAGGICTFLVVKNKYNRLLN